MDSEQRSPNPQESAPTAPEFQQQRTYQIKIETIDKLRKFGLSDEQIAEALEIPLDVLDRVDLDG